MINSKIFDKDNLALIQQNILQLLNNCNEFGNEKIYSSPRAVGDIVQEVLGVEMENCFPSGLINNFSNKFARRAMADLAFNDIDDNYIIIDVKTHNKDTEFNMPNLTSVERLARFYEDDNNFFVILLAQYHLEESGAIFDDVKLVPIEHLKWDCLNIGALGWGQIQITNSSVVNIDRNQTRKSWMLSLCDKLDIFYPKEISKINDRIYYFAKVRDFWNNK